MTNEEMAKTIHKLAGTKIFSVKFIKKDATERKMVCKFNDKDFPDLPPLRITKHGLLTVFDMQKKEYRSVNMNTAFEFKIKGTIYVKEGEKWKVLESTT